MAPLETQPVYALGRWEIDLGRRELRSQGAAVSIGARAFEIIEFLVQSVGKLVTKDDLISRVWPHVVVGESTLQVHISAIRKALGSDRNLLKTISGRGYRLSGEWTVRQNDKSARPLDIRTTRIQAQQNRTQCAGWGARIDRQNCGRAARAGPSVGLPRGDPPWSGWDRQEQPGD
jgi:DNA-binding winged helix-turn-helix (wHTH) protein